MEVKHIIVGNLRTNCYLLISEGEIVVVDPADEADLILKEIEKTGGKVKYIINTHYHYDHVLANSAIKKKTEAEILIHEGEKDFINFSADRFLKEGDKISFGKSSLEVINTPGHSKGSICLLGDNFILTGDTLFQSGYGRTDFEGGSQEEMEKSLERLSKIIKPGMMVYPGHEGVYQA